MKKSVTNQEKFNSQGYLHIPKAIDRETISNMLREASNILESNQSDDIMRTDKGVVKKLAYLYEKHSVFLEMLSHPEILGLACQLTKFPERLVPTWEDMLIKPSNHGIPVQIHQDLALQTVSGNVFSIGIYLHGSVDNPVYFLPGSHKMGPLTRHQIKEVWEERKNEFVPVIAEAGDLVAHNALTVHYSGANFSHNPRYTWYLEFRDLDELVEERTWQKDWCFGRRKILFYSIEKRKQKGLPILEFEFPDPENVSVDLSMVNLRFPHETGEVNYDLESDFNHFIESP